MTEDDPLFTLYNSTMAALFDHHPVRESVAGTVESIAGISPELLYDCHRAFYVPSNMVLTVCGDVEPERVAEIAALHTAPEYAAPAVPDYGGIEPLEPKAMRAEKRMDVSEPMFIAAAKLDTALERGDGALRLITVGSLAARCLFGPSSSFYYGLYADGYLRGNFFRDVSPLAGTLLFECGGSSRDPGLVYERLCETLRAASRDGVCPEELEAARRADYGATLRGLGEPGGVCSALARCHFSGYGLYEGFDVLSGVTAGDCTEFLRMYLPPERILLSTVLPKERT